MFEVDVNTFNDMLDGIEVVPRHDDCSGALESGFEEVREMETMLTYPYTSCYGADQRPHPRAHITYASIVPSIVLLVTRNERVHSTRSIRYPTS